MWQTHTNGGFWMKILWHRHRNIVYEWPPREIPRNCLFQCCPILKLPHLQILQLHQLGMKSHSSHTKQIHNFPIHYSPFHPLFIKSFSSFKNIDQKNLNTQKMKPMNCNDTWLWHVDSNYIVKLIPLFDELLRLLCIHI